MCRIVTSLLLVVASTAGACPFGTGPGPTLREEAVACKFVVYGTLANPKRTDAGGTTDFIVSRVLKSDPAIAGKDVLTIPRYIDIPDLTKSQFFLVFGDVDQGKVDLYRGEMVGPAVAEYLAGALAIDAKDRVRLLKYCAKFLNHHESVVATEAFNEFNKAPDADVRVAARGIDTDKLHRLLRSPDLLANRIGLYSLLLAHAGNRSDTVLLRELLDGDGASTSSADLLMAAFTLLDPQAGWAYTCETIRDPRNEFLLRYAGLRAVRYFQNTRPDVISVSDRLKALSLALRHADMADLAVEDLRRSRCWKLTGDVLALPDREGFDQPIIRRSVLKYALECPDKAAAKHVADVRMANPKLLADVRTLLDVEAHMK
jgi:hypothetical protein